MQFKAVDTPIVIESLKPLPAGAPFGAKQFWQFSGHPKVPPITVQNRAHNTADPEYRFEEMKPRAKRDHPFVHPQKFELHTTGPAKDPFSHLLGQLDFLLQSFRQRVSFGIESNAYSEMATTPDCVYRSAVNRCSQW